MTIHQFNTLTENEKAEATWNGTFLMNRENGNIKYALYNIDTFFVEVTYNSIDNKIIAFQSFETKKLLEVYLESINIIL